MSRDEYPVHTRLDKTPEPTEEKLNTTFFVDAKGVSKSLIKAIIKPTVSHIADAHRKREVISPTRLDASGIYLNTHPELTRLSRLTMMYPYRRCRRSSNTKPERRRL